MTEVQTATEHPLDGFKPAHPQREDEPSLSAQQAADEVNARRAKSIDLEATADAIVRENRSQELPPKATLNLEEAADSVTDFRNRRAAVLAELASAQDDATVADEEAGTETSVAGERDPKTAAADDVMRQMQGHAWRQTQAAAATKQMYEQGLATAGLQVHGVLLSEFPDVKTTADIAALALNDPSRYVRMAQLAQTLVNVRLQAQAHAERNHQEQQRSFQQFSTREDELLLEMHPELKKPGEGRMFANQVRDYLAGLGLSARSISQMWQSEPWFRSAMTQSILLDASRWNRAKQAARDVTRKEPPRVQRPSAARTPAERRVEEARHDIAAATKRLEQTGSVRDATRLLIAKRAHRR